MGRWLQVMVLAAVAATAGCRRSDAHLAAAERAKIRERIEKSYALVPYRGFKILLRARGSEKAPKEILDLLAAFEKTREPPVDLKQSAEVYLRLAIGVHEARSAINAHDEDTFPLLWQGYVGAPPAPWYDNPIEHLLTAFALQVIEQADRSGRAPLPDLAFYELSRAEAQPGWPWAPRAASRLERGLLFCGAEYHYAAEEELDEFLVEASRIQPADLAELSAITSRTGPQSVEILNAIGHFARAWNRMGLGRDKAAEEDIEAALTALDRIGIDNEATQWGWAFIHYRRGRYPEAGQALAKLARSPHLDEATRKEIQSSADQLLSSGGSGGKHIALFSRARAGALIGRALVARAGGLEHILATLLGPERGKKAYQPIAWLDRLQANAATVDAAALKEGARDVADRSKEAGKKGLDFLKSKVDELKK
ncbi:MAG: hypothetical protein EXR72_22805 [Myxococcales bacterium]|nr:hypothetical protein [Myxococcales bacterium]